MSKRTRSASAGPSTKKARQARGFAPSKVATKGNADAVCEDPPLPKLIQALETAVENPAKGECIVYWMRMGDLRVSDNRALSRASEKAAKDKLPLVVIHVLSPQDYKAHDRSARRIDFVLRNLALLKNKLSALDIPFHTTTHSTRRTLPSHVLSLLRSFKATSIYANIEYELDELRRDIKLCELMAAHDMKPYFVHDKCVVDPGICKTKQDKPYTVFSPFQKTWRMKLNSNLPYCLEECPAPLPNAPDIRSHGIYGPLFDTPVPEFVVGFMLANDDKAKMAEIWPAGEEAAQQMLDRFLNTKARTSQMGAVDPLTPGAEEADKKTRIKDYNKGRDKVHLDSTSRLSPYLSAGVITARHCILATMRLLKIKYVETERTHPIGCWVQEIAWRDFYTQILIEFPRVSMGRPFHEKYDSVVWEENEAHLQAWKDGKTGVPIVDAAMRQLKTMGWMHNRLRMITAMFLTKDLMLDWRLGERHFMESLIDGDLASNNGGWQWSASTGTDSTPYFRIFNPYSQSEKADPTGDFIRHYVPELKKLRGPDLHKPSRGMAEKAGYPLPVVKHDEVRDRALRRFKDPGVA